MIHYSCDSCKQLIDVQNDLRYTVKIEVYAALDQAETDHDDDRDNLQDMQSILQRMDDSMDECIGEEVYQQLRFDLCPACRRKFLKNPLGKEVKQFTFSQN
ncbi:MAG: hypothetical protein SGJ20_05845 [Planctomycetota bacterium]|nr:hypothetical protein [Planctomycetota bacterium]